MKRIGLLVFVGWLARMSACANASTFELVGVHSDASSQPTVLGSTLHTLEVAHGRLVVGYGDYGADNGPIALREFDPMVNSFTESLTIAHTESINRVHSTDDGTTYALTTDPRAFDPAGFVVRDAGGGWSASPPLTALHFFDIGADPADVTHRFLVGSGGPSSLYDGVIYESLDSGTTWSVSLEIPVTNPERPTDFARIYGLGELDGRLYIQPVVFGSSWYGVETMVYDGELDAGTVVANGCWANDAASSIRETVHQEIVVRDDHPGYSATPMFGYDGIQLRELVPDAGEPGVKFWDHFLADDTLYALTDAGTVLATQDLDRWQLIATDVPATGRSLAVVGTSLYVGAQEGQLFRTMLVPEPTGVGCGTLLLIGGWLSHARRRRRCVS